MRCGLEGPTFRLPRSSAFGRHSGRAPRSTTSSGSTFSGDEAAVRWLADTGSGLDFWAAVLTGKAAKAFLRGIRVTSGGGMNESDPVGVLGAVFLDVVRDREGVGFGCRDIPSAGTGESILPPEREVLHRKAIRRNGKGFC